MSTSGVDSRLRMLYKLKEWKGFALQLYIMTTIKKAYVEIANLLNENSTKKVSTILPQLMELMTAKSGGGSDIGKTFLKDHNGEVFAVFCYYHKKWELISECEFGAKKGTASGLNTMCKEGVSRWTKQQREAKKSKEALLDSVANGDIEVSDLADKQAEIEEARGEIIEREDRQGYDSADDAYEAFDQATAKVYDEETEALAK